MKVCIVAQFPPPIHGLSKAVETLYTSYMKKKFSFSKIDITHNSKFIITIFRLIFSRADCFYITVSQSKLGNLRDVFVMMILWLRKKKYGVHVHGGLHYREMIDFEIPKWQRNLNVRLLHSATFAVVLSDSFKSNFRGIVQENRIWVIENGVNKSNVPEQSMFESNLAKRIVHSEHHVLFLSNLIASKGYRVILEMARIEKKMRDRSNDKRFVFDFAGGFFSKEDEDFFAEFIHKNQLEKIVNYHGVVDGARKASLLSECSFFCLPTWYPVEGQPISILEAMANGQYIIASNHAAIPDMFNADIGGKLYKKEATPDQIFTDIRGTTDSQLLTAGRNNRSMFQSHFTEEKYLNKFDELFSSIDCS